MTFEALDLSVRYGRAQRPALDGVNMRVPEGTLYAVLGPNGSGKSSLMRALLGVVPCSAGQVRVAGRETKSWSRRALAREIGAVAQAEHLTFPLVVRDFVGMGRYPHLGALRPHGEADHKAVENALRRCDVLELGERDITTLSGGEVQRVRIARALAQEPSGLVLDEPTASLDVRHEMSIFGLLRTSADRGMTVLLITHHINLAARFADRLLLLDRGRVAAEGTVEDVLEEEVLQRVYRWPIAVRTDPVTGAPQVTPLEGSAPDPPA
ncbi:ABC transporter ATP-binding protein [Gemmatimonadota bacterium]